MIVARAKNLGSTGEDEKILSLFMYLGELCRFDHSQRKLRNSAIKY